MVRRMITEELQWRKTHTRRRDNTTTDREFLPAGEIAGIYRDLRKGQGREE